MEFIDDWLEFNRFEESRLTTQEKEIMITTSISNLEDSYIRGNYAYSESEEHEEEEDFERQVPKSQRPSGTPFKELSVPNIIETNSRSAPNNNEDKIFIERLVLSAPIYDTVINCEMSPSLSNRFSNLFLAEDKENANSALAPIVDDSMVREYTSGNELVDADHLDHDHLDHDQYDKESMNDGLILDELPNFQANRSGSRDSLVITPELLNSNDGNITFHKDLENISDERLSPRVFQHHVLRKSIFRNPNERYMYFKNRKCPNSSNSNVSNFKHHRYSRLLKKEGNKSSLGAPEYLCRLCRGLNWVSKTDFKIHLAFSHGILVIDKLKKVFLLPTPKSLFIMRSRSFETYYVRCNDCTSWIRLGNLSNEVTQPRKQGLYYHYFSHYIQRHKED